MTDNIPGGVGIYNVFPNGEIEQVYLNEGYYKLIGKKNEKQNASHDFSMLGMVHKDDKKRFIDAAIAAVRTDGSVNEDIRILCSGGIYKWFNVKANIAEKTDKMCTMYIIYTDIDEKKRLQLKLEDSRRAVEFAKMRGDISNWKFNMDTKVITMESSYASESEMEYILKNVPECFEDTDEVFEDDKEKFRKLY